jgi:Flp pilus assembly protein TadD
LSIAGGIASRKHAPASEHAPAAATSAVPTAAPTADTAPQGAGETTDHYGQGLALKRAGKMQEAAAELRLAVTENPSHADAHWSLAWVLVELGDRDEAAREFGKVIELEPDSEHSREAFRAINRLTGE